MQDSGDFNAGFTQFVFYIFCDIQLQLLNFSSIKILEWQIVNSNILDFCIYF